MADGISAASSQRASSSPVLSGQGEPYPGDVVVDIASFPHPPRRATSPDGGQGAPFGGTPKSRPATPVRATASSSSVGGASTEVGQRTPVRDGGSPNSPDTDEMIQRGEPVRVGILEEGLSPAPGVPVSAPPNHPVQRPPQERRVCCCSRRVFICWLPIVMIVAFSGLMLGILLTVAFKTS